MARVILLLPPDTEQNLRDKAAQCGRTLEAYLEQLAEQDVRGNGAAAALLPPLLPDEEFDRLLDELSGGPPLGHHPADLSRSDFYADHCPLGTATKKPAPHARRG
jgi:hypothetical protein